MIEAAVAMFASRAYVGAGTLFAFFVFSAWFAFVPWRKVQGRALKGNIIHCIGSTIVFFTLALYGGVKPEPPPPPPPPFGPTNSIVIPAARRAEPGRWRIRPSGTFEYIGPLPGKAAR